MMPKMLRPAKVEKPRHFSALFSAFSFNSDFTRQGLSTNGKELHRNDCLRCLTETTTMMMMNFTNR